MVNYFIYAKDYSGSTQNVDFYHENGLKTIEDFKKDVKEIENNLKLTEEPGTESKIVFLHWGHMCEEVDENRTRTAYLHREGQWGTDPNVIIDWLKSEDSPYCEYDWLESENDTIKLLYIITDGEIPKNVVKTCFENNTNMHYEKVVFHAFNENLNEINLSVAASFFKSYCMIYRNYVLFDSVDISTEYDYDKINVHNFAVEKEQLKSYIRLKFIQKYKQDERVLQEIEKLKKLRKRLFQELKPNTFDATKKQKNKVNLETINKNVFLTEFVKTDWFKKLNEPDTLEKIEIEKSISILINYIVSDAKSYSFDALKFDVKFYKSVDEEEIADVNITPEQEIEFPDVILDDEKGTPVVILTEFNLMDAIIFHITPEQTRSCQRQSKKTRSGRSRSNIWQSRQKTHASYSKFESSMECPLYLLDVEGITESIGYFYTINVFKQLLASNTKTDPRTRKPFYGGLVLTDSDQFDKYNDYVLSATYFKSKKVNFNIGMFYFVLWKNCEKLEWMDRNVVELFKKYTLRRIRETVCKIGLSSMPTDPKIKTSLPTALWYCVELSSCIFKKDPQNYKHERLRRYYNVSKYMIEILKYFNYDLNVKAIEKRVELFSHVMILKKIRQRREKVYYLLKKIFRMADGFLTSEIENPSNIYKLNYLKLNHKEMLRDDIIEEKIHLNDYVHLMYFEGDLEESKAGNGTFFICPNTFRPFYCIDRNQSFYSQLVKNTKNVVIINDDDKEKIRVAYDTIESFEVNRVLSRYKLYIDYVKESEKYPNLSQYIKYVLRKKKFNRNLVTIFPSNVYFDLKNVWKQYRKVVKKTTVEEFIKICNASVNRTKRIKAEKKGKFRSELEINNFISSEESKINLKKKT